MSKNNYLLYNSKIYLNIICKKSFKIQICSINLNKICKIVYVNYNANSFGKLFPPTYIRIKNSC